jgi:hypothetical protein
MSDRQLDVPRPRRNVGAFKAPATKAPAPRQQPDPAPDPRGPDPEPAPNRTPRHRSAKTEKPEAAPARPGSGEMVRVHTTLSPQVVEALTSRADASNTTNTEVLAAAFVEHGEGLRADGAGADAAKYEALGFRPPRTAKPAKGRMGATFYMSTRARASLDEAARTGRFASRSAFIDAVLRRALIEG